MRRTAILVSFCLATLACSNSQEFPYQDARLGVDKRVYDLLRRMTPAEKGDLLRALPNARLGIPAWHVQTNPPPSGLALAATWNPEIVAQVGAHSQSAFGAYGEDPWLASRMAVAWTGGVQAQGRIATMLNFPCAATAEVGERAANEIYFPPFRAAIEEAGLWSVEASGCPDPQPLRDWGFRGFVLPPNQNAQNAADDSARRILRAMFASGAFDNAPAPAAKTDPAEPERTERIAVDQGIVLLKNEAGLLPLFATRLKSIGVTGSKDLANAIRRRAGATPVIEGEGEVNIVSSGDQIQVVEPPRGRKALLQAWSGPEAAIAATDVLFGAINPSGKLPLTLAKTSIDARDGIYVGYRYFDKNHIDPLYPFGFGLSYATFEWSDLRIFPASPRYGQTVQVVVRVRNTGARAGAETVEVYVHQVKSSLERALKELKAFRRVELKAGEAKDVALTLDRHSMSFYDPAVHDWATEPGVFEVLTGTSSRDIAMKGSFQLFP